MALVVAFFGHNKILRSSVDTSIRRTVPRSGESSNIRSCGPRPGRAPRRTPGHSPETGAAESGPPPAPRPWLCWHLALEDICDPPCEHPQVTSGHCCLSTQWPKNICEWPKIIFWVSHPVVSWTLNIPQSGQVAASRLGRTLSDRSCCSWFCDIVMWRYCDIVSVWQYRDVTPRYDCNVATLCDGHKPDNSVTLWAELRSCEIYTTECFLPDFTVVVFSVSSKTRLAGHVYTKRPICIVFKI